MTETLRLICRERAVTLDLPGGDWSQCGASATFAGLTLQECVDQAIRQGWFVDFAHLGPFTRQDKCPVCNDGGGSRMTPCREAPVAARAGGRGIRGRSR